MFEMMLISAGGVWLALFSILIFALLVLSSEKDSFVLGAAVMIVAAVTAQYLFKLPVWATITSISIPMLILYFVTFIAIGAVFAGLWKLPEFLQKNSGRIQNDYLNWKENQIKWSKSRNYPSKDEALTPLDLSYDTFLKSTAYNYKIRDNKDRVASWVLLWPFGLAWDLIHKPFVWLWNFVYYGFGDIFERINIGIARKILEEKNK
jgi:hypothetical protein